MSLSVIALIRELTDWLMFLTIAHPLGVSFGAGLEASRVLHSPGFWRQNS